ncbi:MAG TPA: hypothetical protein VKA14_05905 [Gammaproteobacteria bacterium]|nr:hypothetical protein [Gammaproteobacteria bacterium]
MDLMFVVTTAESVRYLAPLTAACERRGLHWSCFFTNDGVKVLGDEQVRSLMKRASGAAVCGDSWDRYMGAADCPVERGSQTEHSAMLGRARRVVSL